MKTKQIKYLSGRTEMAKFDSLMKATFNPPRNWTLLEDLKFYSDELTEKDAEMLRNCGVQVRNSTKTKQYIVTIPKDYVTDMASVPRGCWAFIAPFDVARAAIVHDLLYKSIRQYRWKKGLIEEDKELIENAKKAADKVFLLAMKDAEPKVSGWKIYSAWKAVDLFGRWSIIPNEDNI